MSTVAPTAPPAKKKLIFKSKEFSIPTEPTQQATQPPVAPVQQVQPPFVQPVVQQIPQQVQPVVAQQQEIPTSDLKMKKLKLKPFPAKDAVEQKQPSEVKVEVVAPPQPEKEKVPEKVVPQQPAKTVVSYELIAYFLDKDVQLEVDNDTRKTFDTRLVTFLNRKYEISAGKEFNRNSNKNNTVKPNGSTYNNNKGNYKQYNNNNGNSFPNADTQFQRGDSKKLTTPNLSKNNSAVVSIKRGEEDKDITQKKLKIKEQSAQFLEKMREEKQDNFKKQISEIRLDLNILTPTNFDVIKKKLFELAMIDENLCEHVVEGIIEKARTQKTYSMVYADLCKFMLDESKKVYGEKKSKSGETTPADDKLKWFKNHLYTNIQQTFEGDKDIYNNKMTFAKPKQLQELSTEEEKNQYFADKKKRELLNVKFIGNLYLNKSMNFKIMAICLSELLGRFVQGFCSVTDEQRDNQEVEEAHYEDHLEALIALFEQTGARLEAESKKSNPSSESSTVLNQLFQQFEVRKLNETETHIENLSFEDYFILIDWLRKNKKVSPRIYSLITNLVERKNESWKERLSTQKGPESITTLHQKHEEEMKQNQKELENYEKGRKQGGNNRGYNKNNKQKTVYQPANGKYDEKSGIVRAKEFWAYLDAKAKLQEDYGVANAIADFKSFKDQCDPVTYGEVLIKTVYDCNKIFKDNRVEVAKEAAAFITGEQFLKAFNERLNKSKDESSDFPLFLEFLSELFAFFYKQGTIQYNQLKISYKAEYDEDDQEDLNFVYMQFFEETINLHKQTQPFDAATFIKEQVDPVLKDKDSRYANWVKDNSN